MTSVAEKAEAAVDDIVADIRQRKLLKWLFCEDPDQSGDIAPGVSSISAEVQDEIFGEWERIIAARFAEPSKS